jgi:hypothetical protein
MNDKKNHFLQAQQSKNLTEEIFSFSIKALLAGKDIKTKIQCNENEMKAIASAVAATKRLQEEINRFDASLDSVMKALEEKKKSSAEFKKILGVEWPI